MAAEEPAEETEQALTLEEYTALSNEEKTIWETKQRGKCEDYDVNTYVLPTFEENKWIHVHGHLQKNEGEKHWKNVMMSPRKYVRYTGIKSKSEMHS